MKSARRCRKRAAHEKETDDERDVGFVTAGDQRAVWAPRPPTPTLVLRVND